MTDSNYPAKNPRLRILQVNSAFGGGGVDNQTLELSLGLRELGQQVTLAVSAGSRWAPLATASGLEVETFPERSPLKLAMIKRMLQLMRQRRIQVVHAHQGRDYWPAIIAARLTGGVKVVITRHLMTRPRSFTRWVLLTQADMVAVSKAVHGVLARELRGSRQRIHQIYNGINQDRFIPQRTPEAMDFRRRQGWPDEGIVFGVVGGFGLPRGKGQWEFFEAAGKIARDFPESRFVLVGSGSMEPMLRESIARNDLQKAASIIQFSDEIPLIMNALDVLVHPAVGTEALPTVVFESLASGRPVIASQLDGIPETFVEGRHGLLVPPADVDALADAMRTFLLNPKMRTDFGAAGPEHVRMNFARSTMASNILELYQRLVSGRR